MIKSYHTLLVFLPLVPIVIALLAGMISLRLSRRRWIVHTIGFAAMAFALPIYLRIQALLDPTTILYPGPGDGSVVLL